ncbi:MAG TPA: hypothetical protein VHZ29_02205 [Rhizomicrobium sp.]|jgi:hypothetical protein|nr:hypothetical protein [Rhizomicrobium sp.]
MPRVSAAFFATGVVCVLAGMIYGMVMGATENMTLAPAHAHLNLVGWVTMGLYGTFYALTRGTMSVRLAWINYAFSTAGVLIMIPALALFLHAGNDPKFVPFMVAGEGLTVIGLLVFAVAVFRELVRRRPAN